MVPKEVIYWKTWMETLLKDSEIKSLKMHLTLTHLLIFTPSIFLRKDNHFSQQKHLQLSDGDLLLFSNEHLLQNLHSIFRTSFLKLEQCFLHL